MPDAAKHERKRKAKYRRARVRHFLFTKGPDRLAGGRISRRHLAKDVAVREVEASSPKSADSNLAASAGAARCAK